ncbi:MAG: SET domain-containing protein-lysine N-methyltransferase [Candidatus Paceibacterota bacterium]|jgi:SET domain-containing protein
MLLENSNVAVRKSKNGLGLFSKRKSEDGKIIFEIIGKLITIKKIYEVDKRTCDNTFRFSRKYYISPQGELGDYLNHSCSPNAGVIKIGRKLFIKAIKNIKPRKEITIDYSTILANDDDWKMKCQCGSKNCRKIIVKFSTLPKQLKNKYFDLGVVPSYINKNVRN